VKSLLSVFVFAATLPLIACSSDDPASSEDRIAGTYDLVFLDGQSAVDAGVEAVLTLRSNGSLTLEVIEDPDRQAYTGTWTLDGTSVTMVLVDDSDEVAETWTGTFSDGRITIPDADSEIVFELR